MKAYLEIKALQQKLALGDLPRDEPLFVLRGQDRFSRTLVWMWIELARICGVPQPKIHEACDLLQQMEDWPIKQTPGRPDTMTVETVGCELVKPPGRRPTPKSRLFTTMTVTCPGCQRLFSYDPSVDYECPECGAVWQRRRNDVNEG